MGILDGKGARGGPFYFLPNLLSLNCHFLKVKPLLFAPAIIWFLITIVLFTLPPSRLPDDEIFKIPQQDKIIHFIIFLSLVYLFSWPLTKSTLTTLQKRSWYITIALYALVYGIAIEFIQKYFVPNRSYDGWDILADAVGCLAGCIFVTRRFGAKK